MFKGKAIVLLLLAALVMSAAFVQSPTRTVRAADEYTVSLGHNDEFGSFLVGKDGMTLYTFAHDPLNDSVCYDKCATSWPPLLVDSADKLTADEEIPGTFSTITRKDGKLQVAYNGQPLYYWFKDAKAGDTTGHRVGRVWWVVPPATVSTLRIPDLGNVLVGPKGMTLYMFTKDTADTSNCYDKCATNWPPLLVDKAEDIVAGVNLLGKWGTATRKDTEKLQVTYNGMPLYYWKDDKAIGDATGENVGKVWFTVVPEIAGVNAKGDGLITPDGMTLYTFAKDAEGVSNCTGDCLQAWMPYTIMDKDRLNASSTLKGKWATITRDD